MCCNLVARSLKDCIVAKKPKKSVFCLLHVSGFPDAPLSSLMYCDNLKEANFELKFSTLILLLKPLPIRLLLLQRSTDLLMV